MNHLIDADKNAPAMSEPTGCFHGGAFFDEIGTDFRTISRRHRIINADVLDAWFPPAPSVTRVLEKHLSWLLRTSPPIWAEGLIAEIASARSVPEDHLMVGPGSSSLIYHALRHWLNRSSRVLLVHPTYGEYSHVLEQVIRCDVDRLMLERKDVYQLDLAQALRRSRRPYDLIILVNPNNPTGRLISRADLSTWLEQVPDSSLIWIDEAYIDYADSDQTMEQFAVSHRNVIVCKSLSKVLALSGARAAYICGNPHLLSILRRLAPPWWISLPAQVAAVTALRAPRYYAERYQQTRTLRENLLRDLAPLMEEIIPGTANFLLCHLHPSGPKTTTVIDRCRRSGLFLRDPATADPGFGEYALRVAVKDRATNERIVEALSRAVSTETGRF